MSETQSLGRGLKILNLFLETDGNLSITELSLRLDLDKSQLLKLSPA